MKIKQLVVGELDENCYILEKDGKYLVSDPGDEFIKIDNEIHGELEEILVTHNHFDHIGALKQLEDKYGVKANHYRYGDMKHGNKTITEEDAKEGIPASSSGSPSTGGG